MNVAEVQLAATYETWEINACSLVSDEKQSVALTPLFIRGKLSVMPMNNLLKVVAFPIPKVGELHSHKDLNHAPFLSK